MSRPRFLADHDLNEMIIRLVLRLEPSVDFQRIRDVGLRQSPDLEVLDFAAQHDRILVSHDINTMPVAAKARLESGVPMRGLLLVHQSRSVSDIADSLILIWSASESEEWNDVITFLPIG